MKTTKGRVLFFSVLLIAFSAEAVVAGPKDSKKEEPGKVVHLSKQREYLLNGPGGEVMGEVFVNAKLRALEEKGLFSKVILEAWVKTESLGSAPLAKKGAVTSEVLSLVSFSVEDKAYTGTETRRQLKISVKNVSTSTIGAWSAYLIAKDFTGRIVLQETISDSKAMLEPGKEKELNFYWKPGDKTYSALSSVVQNKYPLTLSGVSIR